MQPNLLVLGGTLEATRLCQRLAEAGLRGTVSMAGRVANPAAQALPLRIGGFGGAEGLARYLAEARISHVIDATHPFAAQMSAHAVAACDARAVPLIAVTDDLHWRRDAKTQFCNMSEAIKRRELAVYRRAALTLTITAEDAHELRAQLPKLRLGVLPYALDGTLEQ